jgi:hypothetical protein
MTYPQDPNLPPPPGGQPPYGAMPAPSAGEIRTQGPRPKSVDTAALLFFISAGLGILGNLIGFIIAGDLAKETAKATGLNVQVDTSPSYGGIIFGLILSALFIGLVLVMRNGANWARIVLTVLGGIFIVLGLFGLLLLGIWFAVGFLGVITALIQIAQLALTIGAIVFMFKSDANQWFSAA